MTEEEFHIEVAKLDLAEDSVLHIKGHVSLYQRERINRSFMERLGPKYKGVTIFITPPGWELEQLSRDQFHRMLKSYNRHRRKRHDQRTDAGQEHGDRKEAGVQLPDGQGSAQPGVGGQAEQRPS